MSVQRRITGVLWPHSEQLQQSVTKDVPDKPDRAKSIDAGSRRNFKTACSIGAQKHNTVPEKRENAQLATLPEINA